MEKELHHNKKKIKFLLSRTFKEMNISPIRISIYSTWEMWSLEDEALEKIGGVSPMSKIEPNSKIYRLGVFKFEYICIFIQYDAQCYDSNA